MTSNWDGYFYIRTTLRDTREGIKEFSDKVDTIVCKTGQSESQLFLDCIVEGVNRRILEVANSDSCDPITAKAIRLRVMASEKARRFREFDTVYEDVGPDQFSKLCRESGVSETDIEEYLATRHWSNENLPWHERAKSWLSEFLFDGNPCPTSTIRIKMVQDKLIDDSDREWARVRKTAERMHLNDTADQGYWRLPTLSA